MSGSAAPVPRSSPAETSDVVVIGGGPAGAAAALRLARLGYTVTLVDKRAPGVPQRGVESAGPALLSLLDAIGAGACVEQTGALRPSTTTVLWETAGAGQSGEVQGDRASGTATPGDKRGLLLDRGRFDRAMLRAAGGAGVHLMRGAVARRPRRGGGSGAADGWMIPVRTTTRDVLLRARYCLDACGRRSLFGGSRVQLSPRTLAVMGEWRDTVLAGGAAGVEAGDAEWYWGGALRPGHGTVAVFLDARRCIGRSRSSLALLYRSLLERSRLFRRCLGGTLTNGVTVRDATSGIASPLIGDGFARAGDAALTIDPLSSQGVQTALIGAIHASAVIHTILHTGNTRAATEFYAERYVARAAAFQRAAASFYASRATPGDHGFWLERARGVEPALERSAVPPVKAPASLPASARLRLATDACIVERPILIDPVITVQPALVHPSLAEPCAFIGGHPIALLLAPLASESGKTRHQIAGAWADRVPPAAAERVLEWLWNRGVLTIARA